MGRSLLRGSQVPAREGPALLCVGGAAGLRKGKKFGALRVSRGLAAPGKRSWGPACTPISSHCLPCPEPERSLKPYSLVRPLLVSALRPVVLLPECLAPRLIRNLLDLPSSRLDFQVCPAGEPARPERGGLGGTLGQPGPLALRSYLSLRAESLSGEEQCTSSAPGAPKAQPATPGLGSRIRAIQESVGKVGAWGGAGGVPSGPKSRA